MTAMTAICPWSGFQFERDQAKIAAMSEQLAEDFGGGILPRGERLSDEQVREYRDAEQRNGEQRRAHAEHLAARHRRNAAGHVDLGERHAARAIVLDEQAAPTVLNLEHDARGPVIVERPGKPATAPTARLSLDEAAQHLHVSPMVAIVELGVFGVLAADDGTFDVGDVERLAQDR